jgi:hypothetical protein
MSTVPYVLQNRAKLATVINTVTGRVNAARDAKAKAKAGGAAAHFPSQLAKLDTALEALNDELDGDDLAAKVAAARSALTPVIQALPEAQARAKHQARIVNSLEPAVEALIEGCELMIDINRIYESRHMAAMAAAISRAKPRSYTGEPMLARTAIKRVVAGQQRPSGSGGPGKRRGGASKRGKGRGGK